LKQTALGWWLLALVACSRNDAAEATRAQASGAAAPATTTPPRPSVSVNVSNVPTPEDVEDDAAQRITEQNLESELDRLEREIQAE
jgi:hypothetical protein